MIEQSGLILAWRDGFATVAVGRLPSCAACKAGKGCGAGVFSQLLLRKPVQLQIACDNTAVGQRVTLGVPEGLVLKFALMLYGLPLLTGLLLASAGWLLSSTLGLGSAGADLLTLVFGLSGFVTVLFYIRSRATRLLALASVQIINRSSNAERDCAAAI